MALLAYVKKPGPSKATLPSPTGPLSLQMPSSCIEAANKCVSEELERTSATTSELDVSANKPAKDFLHHQFQMWYVDQICSQDTCDSEELEPVDLKATSDEAIRCQVVDDHMKSHAEIIVNGFKVSGVCNSLYINMITVLCVVS